jgi:hypothetical protein
MSPRFRRRPDHWPSPHERARALAAERIDQPIDASEDAWLEGHLAGCPACASIAAAFAAQRAELRSLRRRPPTPPRDLWARTAAAIEREAATRSAPRSPARRRAHPSPIPLGAISGLLVIAVVVGASLLSRPAPRPALLAPTDVAASLGPTGSPLLRATPFDVAAGNVRWIKLGANGRLDVFDSKVGRVCPAKEGADCPPIDEPSPRTIQLSDAPASVTQSTKDQSMVVADSATKGSGGTVYAVPAANATLPPAASSSPGESPAASATPATPQPPSAEPPSPPATVEPSDLPTIGPTSAATASTSPTPTATAGGPSPNASVRVTASPGSGAIEIARDVIVVGESEAYSPDGSWFAFSARPADGSHGPDIYVWRPGEPEARPITTDHRSIFAAWLDGRILGSRGVATSKQRELLPQTFLADPATGGETVLAVSAVWRPSVDPQRRLAVYWDGSLELNVAGTELLPSSGRLVLGTWTGTTTGGAAPAPSVSTSPTTTATSPTVSPSSSDSSLSPAGETGSASATPSIVTDSPGPVASPSSPLVRGAVIEPVELASGKVRDWDARWDETGTHLAVWIATDGDPRIGDLTLYSVDAATGRIQTLKQVAALAGFSIGKGRLAWATPRGQDGQGSRVQVLAWTKDAVGTVESLESSEALVVVR